MFAEYAVARILVPMPRGRPGKYSKKLHDTIIQGILGGNTRTTSFALTGMHPDTIYDWIRSGKDHPEKYPQYVSLLEDIEYAEALVESEKVAAVKVAADTGTWQAAAWWLERRRPRDYGRNDTVRHEGEVNGAPRVNVLILEDANARSASRELLRGLAGLGSGSSNEPIRTRALLEPAEES